MNKMDFSLIIQYNKLSTRHLHITHMFDSLVENNNFKFIELEEISKNSTSIENLTKYFINKFDCVPKYIISFSGVGSFLPIINILFKITKVVFIIDDIHHSKSVSKSRIPVINKSYAIFSTYSYQFTRWNLPQPKNLIFFPHSARFLCTFNNDPINKILISGRLSDIYPDRLFATNIAINNTDKFDILKCNIKYRDNIDNIDKNCICGKNFYDQLNKYLCCFVDTSRDYILAKTFEICASGSLLLCMDINVSHIMENIGFINNKNYISCTHDNFIDKINWILDPINLNQVNLIRLEGYTLVKNKHMWNNRSELLIETLRKVVIN
jgi:hypothetical protein